MNVEMDANLTNEVLKRIDALAAKLGTTGEYLWTVLVRQARVEAIQNIVTVILSAIVIAVSIAVLKWGIRREVENDWWGEPGNITAIIASVTLAIVCTVIIIQLSNAIPTLLMNPEYWALKQVLEAMK